MDSVDSSEAVTLFEEMFKDRFSEKDSVYETMKSKALSNPTVIYPWKAKRKQWNKRWDYSSGRQKEERDNSRNNDYRHSRYDSHDKYQDRSQGRSGGSYRDRSDERQTSHDRKWEKKRDSYGNRNQRRDDKSYQDRK